MRDKSNDAGVFASAALTRDSVAYQLLFTKFLRLVGPQKLEVGHENHDTAE
jgi:hypothetical protein